MGFAQVVLKKVAPVKAGKLKASNKNIKVVAKKTASAKGRPDRSMDTTPVARLSLKQGYAKKANAKY